MTDPDLAELLAHRAGVGHLAEDRMHAGQPVWRLPDGLDGASRYRLQITHADTPVWQCDSCRKLTVGTDPAVCAGCGLLADDVFEPLLYPQEAGCRSRPGGFAYNGSCMIAGWDGCQCADGGEVQR